ncbi:MAG: hypothetical protein ACKOF7_00120 [Phycisphaerales bacterium]
MRRLVGPCKASERRHAQHRGIGRPRSHGVPGGHRLQAGVVVPGRERRVRQRRPVPNLVRPFLDQRREDRHGLHRAAGRHQHHRLVEAALAPRQFHQLLLVVAEVGHVAQVDELTQRIGRLERVLAHLGRMLAGLAGLGVP